MKLHSSRLILNSGETFTGLSPAWQKDVCYGEVVFNTGMTGYVESLTDPSYAGQILVFTYPLIGNYGVPDPAFWESAAIRPSGVIMSEISPFYSHFAAKCSLEEWLFKYKIPFMTAVDTRALTKALRSQGVSLGAITPGKKEIKKFFDPNETDLVEKVSIKEPAVYGNNKQKIIAVDCGMKENIVRSLLKFPVTIKRVPYNYDYTSEEYDGLFISNGPGDPMVCKETIGILKKALAKEKPIFGICLGAQLLALAIGGKTFKLPFGHRGHNHPCVHYPSERCYLTSQNHGYAIDEKSLPSDWRVTFRSLNDGSVEGIEHASLPFSAVQFHPEDAPGPVDCAWLFETFYKLL